MTKDLTVGRPWTVLWKFCLPLFGSVIFQQLYNIADSFVAGKFIGEEALAAVGNSYEITLVFIAFAFGCNIGCSIVAARFFGAKKYTEMKTAVYTTLISSAVLCLTLMAIGLLFGKTLLKLINTPDNIIEDSLLYLNIYIFGLPFVMFYNIATGIFSALGDSKTPFIFLACSSTINIGVDILFVTAFNMGVMGVAFATFICQGVSCILAIIVVFKRFTKIETTYKPNKFSITIFKLIALIAIPSILQQSFVSVGNILIQGIINSFGSSVIAGYAGAVKLQNLVITSFTTFGNGVSNYTAQNIGAGKLDRIHSGFKAAIKMTWIFALSFTLIYVFAGKWLLYAFIDDIGSKAIGVGLDYLYIIAPFYIIISSKLVADGVLRGASMMNKFMIATFTDLILRVLLAQVLSKYFGAIGIWIAWPIGWIIATAMSLLFYKFTNWKAFIK